MIKVSVVLIQLKHPEYLTELNNNQGNIWKFQGRFNSYRDFEQFLKKYSFNFFNEIFPQTYTQSSYGIKLNDNQLQERRLGLEQVILTYIYSYFFLFFDISSLSYYLTSLLTFLTYFLSFFQLLLVDKIFY